MGGLLSVACRTLDAYTVTGAWNRGRFHTDRRSSGPGARTETHARRLELLAPRPHGQARRAGVKPGSILSPPPPAPSHRRGEGGGGERMLGKRAGRRWDSGTRPAAWSVRAARKNA